MSLYLGGTYLKLTYHIKIQFTRFAGLFSFWREYLSRENITSTGKLFKCEYRSYCYGIDLCQKPREETGRNLCYVPKHTPCLEHAPCLEHNICSQHNPFSALQLRFGDVLL